MKHHKTYHLHVKGIVQGVGFRPAVSLYAGKHVLQGYVCNAPDGLHIEFNAMSREAAMQVTSELLRHAPPLSSVSGHSLNETTHIPYCDFSIKESNTQQQNTIPVTTDFAPCDRCMEEMRDKNNRRYGYPFITCTQCGPRYSIIEKLPYDRHHTSMNAFTMCRECNAEYNDVNNRRYFSQTNSCHTCGIQVTLFNNRKKIIERGNTTTLPTIIQLLKEGKIVAMKSIGGYLLLCDAGNKESITVLRTRKHRPSKPFALLCRDIAQAKTLAFINHEEQKALRSVAAPIVLLKAASGIHNNVCMDAVAPGLNNIGIMLPAAPLLQLIADGVDRPLVATSANISHAPVIYKDEDALEQLSGIADYIATHNRTILIPQDDSVMRVIPGAPHPVIIRRARGLAPNYFQDCLPGESTTLATGSLMKSSFGLTHAQNIYISQYLGTTDTVEAMQSYTQSMQHFLNLTGAIPEDIVTDKHPGYFSTQLGKTLAEKDNISSCSIQHHQAHFAAVLSENNLLHSPVPVLGVIWDGTGLGDDGQIWGGEFFIYNNNSMLRAFHFSYFTQLLGDKMAKEPRISALSCCYRIPEATALLQQKFTADEWKLYNAMARQQELKTSSAGRVFDAVASLLGICEKQSYEGEAALLIETLADEYLAARNYKLEESYCKHISAGTHSNTISLDILLKGIVADKLAGKDIGYIAARFHCSLVWLVIELADMTDISSIAFSGGVFQNAVLIRLLLQHAGKRRLYFHKQLSPNDENIALGQLICKSYDIKYHSIQSDKKALVETRQSLAEVNND